MAEKATYFVVELVDPEDGAGLAYWQDHGVWVRKPESAQLFVEPHKATAVHSVLGQQLLHIRICQFDPNAHEDEQLTPVEQ